MNKPLVPLDKKHIESTVYRLFKWANQPKSEKTHCINVFFLSS